ncbi:MAG: hypothetical protein ABIK97_00035 [candidate division WOR-3 bacterium]
MLHQKIDPVVRIFGAGKKVLINIFFLLITFKCQKRELTNIPPEIPRFVSGPTNGGVGIIYRFQFFILDRDSDYVSFRIDWGDGNISNWSEYLPSWSLVEMAHSWCEPGIYYVRGQAKDRKGALSPWSEGHPMQILNIWSRTYGGALWDYGYSVQLTSDGGYIIAGETYSLGAGEADVYLIKTDELGNLIWQKTYGGIYNDWGRSVQPTPDGGYIVVGSTQSFGAGEYDVYLIKIDAFGNEIWHKTFGGRDYDYGYSVQQTSDGGYLIVGSTSSFGGSGSDIYLIKTDEGGNEIWSQVFNIGSYDHGYSLQRTPDGGCVIVGTTYSSQKEEYDIFLIKTDGIGNLIWKRTYGGNYDEFGYSIEVTSDGGYVIVGATSSFGAGEFDLYLIKTDNLGNEIWEKTFGGDACDYGSSVKPTLDGGYIIVGRTTSSSAYLSDIYLIKTNNNGEALWVNIYGGNGEDYGCSIQLAGDGEYIIAGWTTSFGSGRSDVYLIKTDAEGSNSSPCKLREFSVYRQWSRWFKNLNVSDPINPKEVGYYDTDGVGYNSY